MNSIDTFWIKEYARKRWQTLVNWSLRKVSEPFGKELKYIFYKEPYMVPPTTLRSSLIGNPKIRWTLFTMHSHKDYFDKYFRKVER